MREQGGADDRPGAATLTISLPALAGSPAARRTARIDPMIALHGECWL
jgi:hypothetical protein